ncbi:hypothetical protein HanLR1_Chr17g0687491 [Helianthus annuus]|nr:hypothetical protein HanLR1_Chr17g0687491 [Helianthus annuus]
MIALLKREFRILVMIRSMMTVFDIGNDKKHDGSVGQSVMEGIVGTEQYEGSATNQ